jgi:hypothetical protein
MCVDTAFKNAGELKDVQWLRMAERGSVQWIGNVNPALQTTPGELKMVIASSNAVGARSLFGFSSSSELGGMSFIPARSDKRLALGLSNGNSDKSTADIDFAWQLTDGSMLQVFEGGVQRGTTFGGYAAGDLLEVRVNLFGQVEYVHNRVTKFTSAVAPVFPLLVDSSLQDEGAHAKQVRFVERGRVDKVVFTTLSSGMRMPHDYGSLKMISGGAGQGARSMATIGSPDAYDGFDIYGVAFTPQYQHRDCTIGLSHGSSTNDIADIDYGIRFHSHYFYVVEKGHQRYWNAQHINAGVDVFEVCKRRFRWVVMALREKE